jgi:hypothetical protein
MKDAPMCDISNEFRPLLGRRSRCKIARRCTTVSLYSVAIRPLSLSLSLLIVKLLQQWFAAVYRTVVAAYRDSGISA